MEIPSAISLKPIGYLKSVFHFKNGTPRQSSLCQAARGILTIEKSVFNNPEHSLDGLQEFSHAWVIFVFHKNNNAYSKAKVKPPRLNGRKVGVFSTRSPYRPNNIGLSLAKIDLIEGSSIHLSGIDILDGTPILDIKPYIPEYDKPFSIDDFLETNTFSNRMEDSNKHNSVDSVIDNSNGITAKDVEAVSNEATSNKTHKGSKSELVSHLSNQPCIPKSKSSVADRHQRSVHAEAGLKSEDTKTDSWDSDQDVATGFYSLSAALDKAGVAISSRPSISVSIDDTPGNDENVAGACEEALMSYGQSGIPDGFATSSDNKSDDQFLDFLVGDVLAKAASQLTLSDHGHQNSESLKNHTDMSDTEDSKILPSAISLSKVKLRKSKGNKGKKHSCLVQSVNTSNEEIQNSHGIHRKGSELRSSDSKEPNSPVTAPWLLNPPVNKVKVSFTPDAIEQLQAFNKDSSEERFRLQMLSDPGEARIAISNILHEEPRSVYRRRHCQDNLYFFALDVLHVTCWFDEDAAQVVRIKPVKDVPQLNTAEHNISEHG